MRYAIYFTPPEHDPLTRAGERWLGRSAFSGAEFPEVPPVPRGLRRLTADAARYGFHATLKAPFHLSASETEFRLQAALDNFCAEFDPMAVRLVPRMIDSFLALVPELPSPTLQALERRIVTGCDRFRMPLTERERAKRRPDSLTPRQRAHLDAYGYPYVLDDFRFHITLTDHLPESDAQGWRRAAERHFGPVLDQPVEIATIGLFVELEPGAPFAVRSLHRIGHEPQRKSA